MVATTYAGVSDCQTSSRGRLTIGILEAMKSSWTFVFSSGFMPAWKYWALNLFLFSIAARSSACCWRVSVRPDYTTERRRAMDLLQSDIHQSRALMVLEEFEQQVVLLFPGLSRLGLEVKAAAVSVARLSRPRTILWSVRGGPEDAIFGDAEPVANVLGDNWCCRCREADDSLGLDFLDEASDWRRVHQTQQRWEARICNIPLR